MSVEFYMDRVSNYQLGGQYLNVDFSRLPASRQADLYRALGNPMAPDNLAIITQARKDFAGAFQQVSALGTLPVPQLGGSTIAFPMNSVEEILAFLFRETFNANLSLSITAREMTVKNMDAEMSSADVERTEKLKAAELQMAAQVASGTVGIVAGGGGVWGARSTGSDALKHRDQMKGLKFEEKKLDTLQQHTERTVKDLQEQTQAKVKQLNGYVDEVNSKGGLSDASRVKIEDQMADNKAQMTRCDKELVELQNEIDQKRLAAGETSKSDAERTALKVEVQKLEYDKKTLLDKKDRLKEDNDALDAVLDMHASRKQTVEAKAEVDRLQKEIDTDASLSESQKREKQYKIERLNEEMKSSTKDHAEAGITVEKHVTRLKGEAERNAEAAKGLQKAWHEDLKNRRADLEAKNSELMGKLDESGNAGRNVSAIVQSINAGAGVVSGPTDAEGREHDAAAAYQAHLLDFIKALRDGTAAFADRLADLASKVSDTEKAVADGRNEVGTNIARNI